MSDTPEIQPQEPQEVPEGSEPAPETTESPETPEAPQPLDEVIPPELVRESRLPAGVGNTGAATNYEASALPAWAVAPEASRIAGRGEADETE